MSVKLETSVIFSNGTDTTEIYVKDILSAQITVGAPTVVNVGLSTALNSYAYTAVDAGSALKIVQQISNARNGITAGRVAIIDLPSALVFTDVSPSAWPVNDGNYSGYITGSGFYGAGINAVQLDDGAGDLFNIPAPPISGDISIYLSTFGSFTATGVYTVYYSLDSGVTRTTTGLTITVS